MGKSFKNEIYMRDGNIKLYQAVRGKKPIWWARIKRPGTYAVSTDRYIEKSMKTMNLAEASVAAEKIYDDLRYRANNDLPLTTLTVAQVYARYMSTEGKRRSESRRGSIRKAFGKFYIPYMGDTQITNITPALATEFWEWRLEYWISGDGAKSANKFNQHLVGSIPAQGTVDQERQSLLQVLRWAASQKYLDAVPPFTAPKLQVDDDNFTPAFTWAEWKKLDNYFTSTYLPKNNEDIDAFWARNPKLNSSHLYGRHMLVAFMRIGVYSGLRPQELLALKWEMVSYYKFNGEDHIKIRLPRIKTKARTNICMPQCIRFLEDLKKHSKFTGEGDFVFNTKYGKKAPSPRNKLIRVLSRLDMLTDRLGNAFKPYSTRHTYVTARILYSPATIDAIAGNIGTSKEMIEKHYDHVLAEQQTDIHTKTNRQLENN